MSRAQKPLLLRLAESGAPPIAVLLEELPVVGTSQTATVGDRACSVALRSAAMGALPSGASGGRLVLTVDGRTVPAWVVSHGGRLWVHVDGAVQVFERVTPARGPRAQGGAPEPAGGAQGGRLVAAMPGRVLDLLCAPGDRVTAGQTLVLLEAMKMELRLAAPAAGVVAAVHVLPGVIVERGALLLELSPEP